MEQPWTKLSERDQKRIISNVELLSRNLVRGTVDIVAHTGFEHMLVTTGEWTVKDGIKLKVNASSSVEDITKLASHGGGSAILVFAEASAFFGQREEATADKDQPDLPIHDEDGVIEGETVLDLKELHTGGDESDDEGEGGTEGEGEEVAQAETQPRRRRRTTRADAPEAPDMPADPTREAIDA